MMSLEDIGGKAKPGTLYGIGVGPGDVRYLTIRAASLIRSVDVVAFFAKEGREGHSRRIAGPVMREAASRKNSSTPSPTKSPSPILTTKAQSHASTRTRPNALPPTSQRAALSVSFPKVIPSSSAPSCTCGAAWKSASLLRWSPGSLECPAAGRARTRPSPGRRHVDGARRHNGRSHDDAPPLGYGRGRHHEGRPQSREGAPRRLGSWVSRPRHLHRTRQHAGRTHRATT